MVKTKHIGSRLLLLISLCLMACCLTACQGAGKTLADSYWSSARKENGLEKYIEKNWAAMDKEGLQREAETAETLVQQFKATALLCAVEEGDNGRETDSPGAVQARAFLAKVLTEEEEFWKALEEAFYPYDCFDAMFAVAGQMDGEVIKHLMNDIPGEAKYAEGLRDAIDEWIEANPVCLSVIGDELNAMGYFDDWTANDWKGAFLYSYVVDNPVRAADIEGALAYVSCLRDSMLSAMEGKFGTEELKLKSQSEITGEEYYATNLAVVAGEDLTLQNPVSEGLPETIETEGKKVIAFYRNPSAESWEGSAAPLRILGDFMLNLPAEEYPASVEEADYYLVLTPSYDYGSFYQDRYTGDETGIQEIWSSTSIDLYEAGTGVYLRHLGNVMEEASSSIVTRSSDAALQYPELTPADILSYIYHHVNEPEAYLALVDQTDGRVEFEKGESVILGGWEVTYLSHEVTDSFTEGIMSFAAGEGCQFIKVACTATNVGFENATFLSQFSVSSSSELAVGLCDASFENYFSPADMITYSGRLNGDLVECGETGEGDLVFEVPNELIESGEGLYLILTLGYQIAVWPLGE